MSVQAVIRRVDPPFGGFGRILALELLFRNLADYIVSEILFYSVEAQVID